jgi:PIN domain nuclease of toxin-antitoxin system
MFEISERYLLDTHVWIWLIEGDDRIRAQREKFLTCQREGRIFGSMISAWEISLLVSLKRIVLSMEIERWLQATVEPGRIQLLPLSLDTVIEANRLPGNPHRDPVDRMLIATARKMNLTLLTRDDALLAYAKQGHLRAKKV